MMKETWYDKRGRKKKHCDRSCTHHNYTVLWLEIQINVFLTAFGLHVCMQLTNNENYFSSQTQGVQPRGYTRMQVYQQCTMPFFFSFFFCT